MAKKARVKKAALVVPYTKLRPIQRVGTTVSKRKSRKKTATFKGKILFDSRCEDITLINDENPYIDLVVWAHRNLSIQENHEVEGTITITIA